MNHEITNSLEDSTHTLRIVFEFQSHFHTGGRMEPISRIFFALDWSRQSLWWTPSWRRGTAKSHSMRCSASLLNENIILLRVNIHSPLSTCCSGKPMERRL